MKPPLVGVASDPQRRGAEAIYARYRVALKGLYSEALPLVSSVEEVERISDVISRHALVLVAVCTGGTSDLVLKIAERTRVLMLAHASQNSLASALNAAFQLRKRGAFARIVQGLSDETLAEVQRYARAGEILAALRGKKILLLNADESWASSRYNVKFLSELGLSVEYISGEELVARVDRAPVDESLVRACYAGEVAEVTRADVERASRIYSSIRELLREKNASMCAFRCFPFLLRWKTTPCLALSRLLDEGITAACEGDLSSLLMLEIMRLLTGRPAFMANVEEVSQHTLKVAHCTIAMTLVEGAVLRSHFETGYPLAIEGRLKEGARVTVACFSPDFSTLFVTRGRIVRGTPWSEEMCRTQAVIEVSDDATILVREAVNRHVCIAFGDVAGEIRALGELLGVRVVP